MTLLTYFLQRTRNALRQSAAALMAALQIAAGAMLIGSVGINFANIIGRYFLSVSLSWAEEVMLFLMIGCVFLAAGPVGFMGRNIRMDVVVSALPPRLRTAFEVFSDLVTIATCIALAVFAWPVLTMLGDNDQRSASANIPLIIPQAAVPLGLLLMALLIAVRLILQGAHHDHAADEVIASRDPGIEH